MLKSVYICNRKQNRVVFSVQKIVSTKWRFWTNLPQPELHCCGVRPELVCPCPTDRTPSVSAPYVTVTHEGRYPCLEDMHITDRHRRRCDINGFEPILCNLTTYSTKLEILALQTKKLECNCNYHKLWFNSWHRQKLAIKIWVGELWVLKIYGT